MHQLRQQLKAHDFTLLVSLPANSIELAQAALRGGAQGLKVHVNVEHFASGTRFGSWLEERAAIAEIVQLANEHHANVGIVPGASVGGKLNFATEAEFADMANVGLDYFDAYPADAPAWSLSQKHLDVMLAAYHGGTLDELRVLEELGMTLCEASIMHHDDYGKSLSARDLAQYRTLTQSLKSPVIVPSQKKLTPHDMESLKRIGVRGVLIGAIVTGRDVQSIEAATREFAQSLQPHPSNFGFAVLD